MFKFKAFKATLNLVGKNAKNQHEEEREVYITGAYTPHKEEFFDTYKIPEPTKKVTSTRHKVTTNRHPKTVKPSKSTGNLTNSNNGANNLSASTPNVSSNPRGVDPQITQQSPSNIKINERERKKLEKQRQAEIKKQKQEQIKLEKLRKQREKEAAKKSKRQKGKKTPQVRQNPLAQAANPLAVNQQGQNNLQQQTRPQSDTSSQYTTNTLESSISRTTGPPPYTSVYGPRPSVIQNSNDNTGNTSFGKPIEPGSSWDLIAQHRQQINRPPVLEKKAKQTELYYDAAADIEARRKSLYV